MKKEKQKKRKTIEIKIIRKYDNNKVPQRSNSSKNLEGCVKFPEGSLK